jgi:hypothetical protein
VTGGVTGCAWATTLIGGRAAAGAVRAICCCCWIGMGRPGFSASSAWRCWNGAGPGGGVDLATAGLLSTAAGGLATLAPADGACPSTLATCGATFGAGSTVRIAFNCVGVTLSATCCTGRALASAFCGTAVTAPGTLRFM